MWSLFVHVGSAIYWRLPARAGIRNGTLGSVIAAGTGLAALIVASLAGGLYPVSLPDEYRATFGG